MAASPILFLIAGPNGAGKTRFYEQVLAPRVRAPFINADIIQRDELGNVDPAASYEAARTASARRDRQIAERRSFITETVFSHPSKLDLLRRARSAGFRLMVFHIQLASADLAEARVAHRAATGGHDVPSQKIRARFERNGAFIKQAVLFADRAQVFDNSRVNKAPKRLMETTSGLVVFFDRNGPAWFNALYGDLVKSSR